jgi:rRNA-processing protein FCF1
MLEKQGCVILPQRNYQELAKLAKNSKKDTLAKQSQYVLNNLEAMIAGGRIEIIGDANDPFADAVLLSVALKFRTQHNLIFITQDKALANDLHKIAKFESIRPREGQTISIFKIDRDGRLKKWLYHKETTAQSFKCPSKTPTVKQDNQAKTIPWWKA